MDLQSGIVFIFLFLIPLMAYADIYCPDVLICYENSCVADPLPNPDFYKLTDIRKTPLMGIYYFASAYFNKKNSIQCVYDDDEGRLEAIYKTKQTLIPDREGKNDWKKTSNIGFSCKTSSYISDPQKCPFIGEDKPKNYL